MLVGASTATAAPPANDNWANRTALTGTIPQTVNGTTVEATTEAGETSVQPANHSKSVWYQFQPSASGPVTFSLCDSPNTFDSIIGIYSGSTFATLDLEATDDESCPVAGTGHPSEVTATLDASTVYTIMVAGYEEAPGQNLTPGSAFELDIAAPDPAPNDNLADAITIPASGEIDGTNFGATKEGGEANHGGNAGGASVWFTWTAPATGQAIAGVCGDFDTLVGVYTGTSYPLTTVAGDDDTDNGCGSTLRDSRATFAVTAGQVFKIAVDGFNGDQGSFTVEAEVVPPAPANDNFAAAQALASANTTTADGTLAGATTEAGEPDHFPPASTPFPRRSVWYSWTAPASGSVTLDTCDTETDTVLGLYTGTALNGLTQLGTDDDSCPGSGGRGSTLTLDVVAGTAYRLAVDGYESGPFHLELALTPDETTPPPPPPPPPGGGGEDTTAPETTISAAPPKKTAKKSVKVEFTSNEAGATFECSLNGKPFAACTSGAKFRSKKGKNQLQVRATDAAGNVDASPASVTWKFKKKKKRK
jgi:hypothetical protein